MIQEIITYIIICLSVIYTLYHLVKMFIPSKKHYDCCGGCTQNCAACKIKPLLEEQQNHKRHHIPTSKAAN